MKTLFFLKYSASRMEQDAKENVKVHLRFSSTPLLLLQTPGRNRRTRSDQSAVKQFAHAPLGGDCSERRGHGKAAKWLFMAAIKRL